MGKQLTREQIKAALEIFYTNSAGYSPRVSVIEDIAAVLQYAQPEPTPARIDGDVVERMCSAYHGSVSSNPHEVMTVAARVLLDEVEKAIRAEMNGIVREMNATEFISAVRARIEKAEVDPAVEVVEDKLRNWPYRPSYGKDFAVEIVAAVDRARSTTPERRQ